MYGINGTVKTPHNASLAHKTLHQRPDLHDSERNAIDSISGNVSRDRQWNAEYS